MKNSIREGRAFVGLLAIAILVAVASLGMARTIRSINQIPDHVWYEEETLSTSWTCHELVNETGASSSDRTFGYTVDNLSTTTNEGVCFKPGETSGTIGSTPCTDDGVLPVDQGGVGPVSLDGGIQSFCWRSVSGSPVATFIAEW